MTRWRGALLLGLLAAGLPSAARAQDRGPNSELTLVAGPSVYELSGSGTSVAVNLGVTTSLYRNILLFQPNFGYFTYRTAFGHRTSWLFPEVGLQVQAHLGTVRPYVGGGLGAGGQTLGNQGKWEVTLHAAAGVRARLAGRWGLQAEVRLRAVDPWQGHTTDIGLGVTHAAF